MSEPKHTPEPWEYNPATRKIVAKFENPSPQVRRLMRPGEIAYASIATVNCQADCTEANACLLAAAPELLERLTFLLDAVERGEVCAHHISSGRAAIAKATSK